MSAITQITVAVQDARADTSVAWFTPEQSVLAHIDTLADSLTVDVSQDGLTRTATAVFHTLEKYVAYLGDATRQQFVVDRETYNATYKISTVVSATSV